MILLNILKRVCKNREPFRHDSVHANGYRPVKAGEGVVISCHVGILGHLICKNLLLVQMIQKYFKKECTGAAVNFSKMVSTLTE